MNVNFSSEFSTVGDRSNSFRFMRIFMTQNVREQHTVLSRLLDMSMS